MAKQAIDFLYLMPRLSHTPCTFGVNNSKAKNNMVYSTDCRLSTVGCRLIQQFYLGFFLLLSATLYSQKPVQTISPSARISLMTVAPGEFVYSTFGHSAIRVFDPAQGVDRCYNYGTFQFDQPNFLLKFCRGKLLYFLDIESYRGFEYGNLADRRTMQEQYLQLDSTQRQRLFALLQENAQEENRYYQYDFFYDNCATRIRDIVQNALLNEVTYDSTQLPMGTTMRQLLRPYLVRQPWMGFGIDLVLGTPADRRAAPQDFMFLPDGLHNMFGTARLPDGRALVYDERLTPPRPFPLPEWKPGIFDRPLLCTSLLVLIGLLCMLHPRAERIFDTVFWFVIGLAGLIMALLWFATDHSATKTNYNLMWALPTHLLVFWRLKSREWMRNYFAVTSILAGLCLIFWKFWPQELPAAAMPLAGLVALKGLWGLRRKG